jgi:hypothetical protein
MHRVPDGGPATDGPATGHLTPHVGRSGRGSAARTRAAGRRRAGPAVRAVRGGRGRGTRGTGGGSDPMAGPGRPRAPSRLVADCRPAQPDRSVAKRQCASAPGGGRGRSGAGRAAHGWRRHPRPAVHVLPSGPGPACSDRVDVARCGWPDDRGDRGSASGARGDDGQTHHPGQAAHHRSRGAVRAACRR